MVRRGPKLGAFKLTGMPGPSSPMIKFGDLPPPQRHNAQGRCRLFHCVSYLPLPSKTCTRWFSLVGDIDPAVGDRVTDIVHDVELPGIGARTHPRFSAACHPASICGRRRLP